MNSRGKFQVNSLRQTVIIPRMVQNDELIKGAHKQTCIFHIHHNDIASWMSAA